eukprot:g2745.t1
MSSSGYAQPEDFDDDDLVEEEYLRAARVQTPSGVEHLVLRHPDEATGGGGAAGTVVGRRTRKSKAPHVRLEPLDVRPPKIGGGIMPTKASSPRTMRSFIRNFLADEHGTLRDVVDLRQHAKDSGTSVTNATIQEVADIIPDLRGLSIRDCREVSDVGMWVLARSCTELRTLDLSGCLLVTHIGLRSLSLRCRLLESVDLTGCGQTSDLGLRVLAAGCWNLRTLKLRGCNLITDTGVAQVARMCRYLQYVDLSKCEKVCEYGDKGLVELANNCPMLRFVDLTGCAHVGDGGVRALARGCPELASLRLAGCDRVGSVSVRALGRGCTSLTELSLDGCKSVDNPDLAALARGASGLKSLNLRLCANVHGSGLEALAEHCGLALHHLDLYGCYRVDDDSLERLGRGCFAMQSLNLTNCPRVTHDGLESLLTRCTRLVNVNLTRCNQIRTRYLEEMAGRLPYVELATAYRGLKELPDAVDRMAKADRIRVETAASTVIQAAWRGVVARGGVTTLRRLAMQAWVVPKIQGIGRGFLARRELAAAREARRRRLAGDLIVRVYRGHVGREAAGVRRRAVALAARRKRAATDVQRVARGRRGRVRSWARRREVDEEAQVLVRLRVVGHLAVRRIQAWWRGYLGRAEFLVRWLHAQQLASVHRLQRAAAIRIQRVARGHTGRVVAEFEREKLRLQALEEWAARKLQCAYRGHQGRAHAAFLREAARYKRRADAACMIQSAWRACRGKHLVAVLRAVNRLRAVEVEAVMVVQCWWRGLVGRRLFVAYKEWNARKDREANAAVEVQRVFRGHKYGREEAEVRRQKKDLEALVRPIRDEIRRLEEAVVEVGEDMAKTKAVLEASARKQADIVTVLDDIKTVKHAFYDTALVTGTKQRFKTEYLREALDVELKALRARAEFDTRTLVNTAGQARELKRLLRVEVRKLQPIEMDVDRETREERHVHLRQRVRHREAMAVRMQARARGFLARQAFRRCGGKNYWHEAYDADGVPFYTNSWTKPEAFDKQWLAEQDTALLTARSAKKREASQWVEYTDPETGHTYYYNWQTDTASWDKPKDFDQDWLDTQDVEVITSRSARLRKAAEWEELKDPESGCLYYFNLKTGEVRWDKPAAFDQGWLDEADKVELTDRSVSKRQAGDWQELNDPESGCSYFFNEVTGEAQWIKPSGFDQQWLDEEDEEVLTARSTCRRQAGQWEELHDPESGCDYYYNIATGATQWDKPVDFEVQHRLAVLTARVEGGEVAAVRTVRDCGDEGPWVELSLEPAGDMGDGGSGGAEGSGGGGSGGGSGGGGSGAEKRPRYFFNTQTQEYSLERPAGFERDWLSAQDPAQITSRSARVRNIGEEGWSEMTDPVTGARFYHNDILDEQLEVDRREYPDRDTHESWVRFYVGKGDFLTADSVVEQMLQLQTDAAGGNGGGGSGGGGGGSSGGAAVATIAEPEPNAEDRSWMEQGFQEMVQEEHEQKR